MNTSPGLGGSDIVCSLTSNSSVSGSEASSKGFGEPDLFPLPCNYFPLDLHDFLILRSFKPPYHHPWLKPAEGFM
jgi:hypothetical protein